ncbi:MAG TPA: superinfection immunity protein [Mesorhizobium sp.]|nr:superinfection immunity protein [Mesorhizobium sp.]
MSDDVVLAFIFGGYALLWLVGILLFITPTVIAFRREHPNRWLILAVNAFLGSTGIGWGVALVWALHAVHRTREATGAHGGESGLNLFANDVSRIRLEPTRRAAQGTTETLKTAEALQEIERFQRLKEQGFIGEEDFAKLKAAVLQRL